MHLDLLLWQNLHGLSSAMTSLVSKTHLGSVGGGWLPLVGGSWSGLLQHLVDLLERQTLGLWNEEVGEDEGGEAEGAPHEEDLCAEVGLALLGSDEVWSDNCDDLKGALVAELGFREEREGGGIDLRSSTTS